jgi:hypothetical protein
VTGGTGLLISAGNMSDFVRSPVAKMSGNLGCQALNLFLELYKSSFKIARPEDGIAFSQACERSESLEKKQPG